MTKRGPRRASRSPRGRVTPFERYKEALRLGHLAAVRGDVEGALAAYEEAAAIARDRPLPRTSAGLALARSGRHADALGEYDAALRLAPRDETSLVGRAESLAALGRRGEAATDLDLVADIREADGRLADACDAARRALELAEARHRRRQLESLIERLLATELDERGEVVLEAARRTIEPEPHAVAHGTPGPEPGSGQEPGPEPGPGSSPAVPVPDEAAIVAQADQALEAGDHVAAGGHLLELASWLDRSGRVDAALDACYRGVAVAPGDVDLHLRLVRLYAERGWTALAREKLELLGRLADLDQDAAATARIAQERALLTAD